MADQKISQLSDGGTSQATDEYVIARSGANYRIDGASIAAAATSVGTLTSLTVSGDLTVDTSTLKVDSTNNRVGIGTATPAYNVQVSGASPVLNLNGTGTTGTTLFSTINDGSNGVTAIQSYNGGILAFDTGSTGAGQTERMRLDASGNLGIGTASPSDTLHVVGNALATGSAGSYPRFISTVGAKSWELGYRSGTSQFEIREDGTPRVEISNGGNLGLGVTPSAWAGAVPLAIQMNGNAAINAGAALYATCNGFYNGTNWKYQNTAAATYYLQNAGAHQWFNAPSGTAGNAITFTQAMTLDASGNLGVGGTPTGRFFVQTDGGTGRAGTFYSPSTTNGAQIWISDNNSNYTIKTIPSGGATSLVISYANDSTERLRITSGGDLFVGNTAKLFDERLGVTSTGSKEAGAFKNDSSSFNTMVVWNAATTGDNAFVAFGTEATYTGRGSITYNRGAGQVAYNVTSDERLKDNIADAGDAGAMVDAMQVRQFDWKETGTHLDYGFVAQELHAVAPHAVTVPEDGEKFWSVDYSKLVPMLVKEIQSLRARVAALES